MDIDLKTITRTTKVNDISLSELKTKRAALDDLVTDVKEIVRQNGWIMKSMTIQDGPDGDEWSKFRDYLRTYVDVIYDIDIKRVFINYKEVTIIYKGKEN